MKKKSYLELTPSQRREERRQDVFKSVQKRRKLIDLGMPDDEAKKSLNTIITRAGPQGFDRTDIMIMDKEVIREKLEREEKAFQKERAEVLAKRPKQEAANPLGARTGRATMKDGGKGIEALRQVAPEVVERMGYQEGGDIDSQMEMMLGREEKTPMEMPMLPDEEMEEDYVDYVVEETLSNEDRNYLIGALEQDDRLSVIFDQVIETAHEFSGSGPIKGPGSGVSDSIPARLSDGEFVFTTKATEEIGVDNLMSMMKDAEAAVDERQQVAEGGEIEEEIVEMPVKAAQQQNIRVSRPTVSARASRQEQKDLVGDEIKKRMMLDPNQKHVRS